MESDTLITRHGFELPRFEIAESAAEAGDIAEDIGFPVVMKIESPDIQHKTDVGGVELNLYSRALVEEAYEDIVESVRDHRPDADIDGVRVEEMCEEGVEVIIGLDNNDQFGPVLMFGLGGVFTEVLRDVSFRTLPITEADAREMITEIDAREMLEGYRGEEPVSDDMLVDLLTSANDLWREVEDELVSVDLNPIAVWEDQHRVLDAEVVLDGDVDIVPAEEPDTRYIDEFFTADSIAVVGASEDPGKVGGAVMQSVLESDHDGDIYPVNPNREEVRGLPAYGSVADVPDDVDLVVVCVGLELVPDMIEACGEKGVHNMVIVSGGGKEVGGDRESLEAEIVSLADEHDVRIIGPNCIGVFDGHTRLDTFFQVPERMERPPEGNIAVLSQSGTVGCAFLEKASDTGLSKFVNYGNRADVDEADLISYLADDPNTDVIATYIEGISNGRKFVDEAAEVAEDKPIVVYKAGRTQEGAQAAVSHTGFFGGTYDVYEGAFTQAGLTAVDSIDEMVAAAKAQAMQPGADGTNVAILSNGAGPMVQVSDRLTEYGLGQADLEEETVAALREEYPDYFIVQNPLDVTGSATSEHYRIGIEGLLDDPNVDVVISWFVFQDTPLDEAIVEKLGRLNEEADKPIIAGAIGGPYTEKMSSAIEDEGVPVFHTVRDALAAAKALANR